MIEISESIEVEVAAARLWNIIEDYSLDVLWRGDVVEMTPNPPGLPALGSQIHEIPLGRTYVHNRHRYRVDGSVNGGSVCWIGGLWSSQRRTYRRPGHQ